MLPRRRSIPCDASRIFALVLLALVTAIGCVTPGCGGSRDPAPSASTPKRRIVSLFPSWTETLFALGAGDRLVARSSHCTFPAAATRLPALGDGWTVNTEALLRLEPDLVVVFGEHLRDRIGRLGIETISVRADTLEEVYRAYVRLATAIGEPARGEALADRVRVSIERARTRFRAHPRKRVLFYVDPRAGSVVGADNFVHELLVAVGGINVAAESAARWPTYSLEAAVRARPDVVLYGGADLEPGTAFLEAWPPGTRLTPVEDLFVTRSGPRLAEAAEVLSRLIHGE